ncbi:uncharacterized protein LOC118481007 [Helianthus annuus]|uniref:uncharacterized protein LOC118481007 n=1 Tax=Helianthus annuus TaxID=4232 RepID=UPI001652C661|nr:uncharacterized protein LOC118481007 [Helianthus annuus]
MELVDAQGRSGGLVMIWDPSVIKRTDTVKGEFFVTITGSIEGTKEKLNVCNVYVPNDVQKKRIIWMELSRLKQRLEGLWLLAGDFNEVMVGEDRMNSKFDAFGAVIFNKFIADAGLLEYHMSGSRFTFMTESGSSMSKIEPILVCDSFMNKSCAKLEALPRYLSDHNPLLLSCTIKDYGPVPFRLYNSWVSKEGMDEVIKSVLENHVNGEDWMKNMGALLKRIKIKIKEWRKAEKEKEEKEVYKAKKRVEEIELKAEKHILKEKEREEIIKGRFIIRKHEKQKIADLKQKAKINWARLGGENSGFFHKMINCRKSRNRINIIKIDGRNISDPKEVKEGIMKVFKGDI